MFDGCVFHLVPIELKKRVRTGVDRFNAPVYETQISTVAGVLPQPGGSEDLGESRPEGAKVDMTFHFPKGYGESLKGATIAYGGADYRVIGDPQPYNAPDTPGSLGLTVETERVNG